MNKLSDTQSLILSAASQRPELIALPLPASLRGGAARKVVAAMLDKGLLQEVDANLRQGEPVWRSTGDGHGTTLVATDVGLAAISIDPEEDGLVAEVQGQKSVAMDMGLTPAEANMLIDAPAKAAPKRRAALDLLEAVAPAPKTVKPVRTKKARAPKEEGAQREGTKQATLIAMLAAPSGATVAEIMAETGWLAHTVRGAMAGSLKKKLGMQIDSAKEEGRGRVYRSQPAAKEV